MKCADARAELLTADPGELRGIGASPVAEHIRHCDRCRAAARVILDEEAALAEALETVARPAGTADQVADAVLATVAAQSGADGSQDPSPGLQDARAAQAGARVVSLDARRRAARMRNWRVWAPVALAAALAAVLLARPRRDWQVPAPGSQRTPTQVAVSAPPGKSVVVFATRNPDIKVIWFYGSKD